MENRRFDQLVRAMTSGASRRSVLRRAAGTAIAGPLAVFGLSPADARGQGQGQGQGKDKDNGKDKSKGNAGGACRGDGHPCEGNQDCCEGFDCRRTGPGYAHRCTGPAGAAATSSGQTDQAPVTTNQVCPGDCQQITQAVIGENAASFGAPPSYWVEVACAFDASSYQTVCTCFGYGQPGAPRIQAITLPAADICAFVILEESQPGGEPPPAASSQTGGGQASAGTGGEANADAQGGAVVIGDVKGKNTTVTINASGGTADADASGGDSNVAVVTGDQGAAVDMTQLAEPSLLTLTLAGEVAPGRLTTYWLDTDAGRRPAPGPALLQVANETAGTGAIIAEAMACDIAEPRADYDWFGQCGTPAAGMQFGLYAADDETTPVATLNVDDQGRAYFGGLPPGTYQLKPEGASWCYAESNRVDANGGVLVEADVESHVWSFSCGTASGN